MRGEGAARRARRTGSPRPPSRGGATTTTAATLLGPRARGRARALVELREGARRASASEWLPRTAPDTCVEEGRGEGIGRGGVSGDTQPRGDDEGVDGNEAEPASKERERERRLCQQGGGCGVHGSARSGYETDWFGPLLHPLPTRPTFLPTPPSPKQS